jgi:hypothetical protein
MKLQIRSLGWILVALGGWEAAAQTVAFPNYRVVLDGTAKARHYLDFFNYNPDFHKWLSQQAAGAAAAQLGVTAAQAPGVDQLAGQVAAQMQQLSADRDRDLAAYSAAQRDAVLRAYDFRRVRTALEGALRLAQSLDEGSWNKLRAYITGPFRNLPKTKPITWD